MCNLFIKEFLYTAVTLQEPIELECMLYSCLVSKLVLNLRNKLIKGCIRYIYIWLFMVLIQPLSYYAMSELWDFKNVKT